MRHLLSLLTMTKASATPEPKDHRPIVALAVLHQDGSFLMQLRDDNPNIMYPGHWGFFGGHLEPGETSEAGVRRELLEEIGYCPSVLTFLDRHEDCNVIRYLYYGELDVAIDDLALDEGLDMQLLSPEDIRRGTCHSKRINQVRPLGLPHQTFLLNYLDGKLMNHQKL